MGDLVMVISSDPIANFPGAPSFHHVTFSLCSLKDDFNVTMLLSVSQEVGYSSSSHCSAPNHQILLKAHLQMLVDSIRANTSGTHSAHVG